MWAPQDTVEGFHCCIWQISPICCIWQTIPVCCIWLTDNSCVLYLTDNSCVLYLTDRQFLCVVSDRQFLCVVSDSSCVLYLTDDSCVFADNSYVVSDRQFLCIASDTVAMSISICYSFILSHCASPILCWIQVLSWRTLTPSLPQPVKFPGWMMNGHTCKQYSFRSYNIFFQCYALWWKSFHTPVPKRRQKGSRVSNVTLVWVIFKWHGSGGVKHEAALIVCRVLLY